VTYTVKEIFYTLQGEGAHAGRPAVFCRFAGCNLWTGREADRASAVCQFCDTDFVGVGPDGGRFDTAQSLADAVAAHWPTDGSRPTDNSRPFVVCTGGEPLLQLDEPLVDAFHAAGLEIAIETNGTQRPPRGIDWICVSPKANADLLLTTGDELKLVYPQDHGDPDRYAHLAFEHFYLQPMDGPTLAANTQQAIDYCLRHPQWRLSLQSHKLVGLR
jgi:7-carboxy-7-deazaguanine synthase (Cx14CxxC type)